MFGEGAITGIAARRNKGGEEGEIDRWDTAEPTHIGCWVQADGTSNGAFG